MTVTVAEVPFNGELSLAPQEDGQPKARISLAAEVSNIGELIQLLMQAEGIEGMFDNARLTLSANGATVRTLVETAELRFAMRGATLSYGHDTGGRPVEFALDRADMVFPATAESRVTAEGSLLGEPFSLDFKGGTFIDNFIQRRWPIELIATGGGELRIDGTVRQPEGGTGPELDFALIGEQIGGLASWIGVSSEATMPHTLNGKAVLTERGFAPVLIKPRSAAAPFLASWGSGRKITPLLLSLDLNSTS